jgi:hypothetical protein
MNTCAFIDCGPADNGNGSKRLWRCQKCGTEQRLVAASVRECRIIGPGGHLMRLLKSAGIVPTPECGCDNKASQMDRWGVAGCVQHREEIIGWLNEAAAEQGWAAKLSVAWKSGCLTIGGLVDKAIAAAEGAERRKPEGR